MKKSLALLLPLLMSSPAFAADSTPTQPQKTVLSSGHGGKCTTPQGKNSKECAKGFSTQH